jgi:hypothetical protein
VKLRPGVVIDATALDNLLKTGYSTIKAQLKKNQNA